MVRHLNLTVSRLAMGLHLTDALYDENTRYLKSSTCYFPRPTRRNNMKMVNPASPGRSNSSNCKRKCENLYSNTTGRHTVLHPTADSTAVRRNFSYCLKHLCRRSVMTSFGVLVEGGKPRWTIASRQNRFRVHVGERATSQSYRVHRWLNLLDRHHCPGQCYHKLLCTTSRQSCW